MLAITPLGDSFFSAADIVRGGESLAATNGRGSEWGLPQIEILPDSEEGGLIPIEPPMIEPPTFEPAPPQQERPEENTKEEPGGDGGLIVDQGQGGESPTDASPYDGPSPREVHSVLQMLAALKYPVGGAIESEPTDEPDDFEFAQESRERSRELDGGAVGIAVGEVADELEAASPTTEAAVQSLLEIAIPIDRSAGRYQAFEVLTTEEVRFVPADTSLEVDFAPTLNVSEVESQDVEIEAAAAPLAPRDNTAIPLTEASGESAPVVADDERSSAWSLAIAFVAFGFVLQLLPKKQREQLKTHAGQLWQWLVTGPG